MIGAINTILRPLKHNNKERLIKLQDYKQQYFEEDESGYDLNYEIVKKYINIYIDNLSHRYTENYKLALDIFGEDIVSNAPDLNTSSDKSESFNKGGRD